MKKTTIITVAIIGFIILLPVGYFVMDYFAIGRQNIFFSNNDSATGTQNGINGQSDSQTNQFTNPSNSNQQAGTDGQNQPGAQSDSQVVPYQVERYITNLEVPWSIVFTPTDTNSQRMLITERPGRLRVAFDGTLQEEPLYIFEEVVSSAEEGLMGLALHPDYESNKYLYVSYAYVRDPSLQPTSDGNSNSDTTQLSNEDTGLAVKVVRYTDEGSTLSNPQTIIDFIPAARFHAGSRIAFGPDGKLYITTGDAVEKTIAQDINSLGGKILRLNPDGSIPTDNPYPDNPVWSYGHRNPQGLDWHPQTGELYSTEHGPSLFDGPAGGDEINRIVKGGNFGWPEVSHQNNKDGLIAPVQLYTPALAPGSGQFYTGDIFPQFQNNYLIGGLRGQQLIRVQFAAENPDEVVINTPIEGIDVGRIRAVTTGPDGYIYFSTSNRDGRGNPDRLDDSIYRLVPVK